MSREIYAVVFVAAILGFFSAGTRSIAAWVWPRLTVQTAQARLLLISAGVVSVLAATFAANVAGLNTIGLLQILVIAVSVLGICSVIRILLKLHNMHGVPPPWDDKRILFILCGAAFGYWLSQWLMIMADLPGLPTCHDGVTHSQYVLRILQHGRPILGGLSLGFEDQFGPGKLPFYPTGTHSLTAIFFGWGLNFGFHTAELTKALFVLVCASIPFVTLLLLLGLFKDTPAATAGLYLFSAITCYRYPVWGADSAGFSRVVAQFFLLPIVAALLSPAVTFSWLLVVIMAVLPVSYMLHPSMFVLLSIVIAWELFFSLRGYTLRQWGALLGGWIFSLTVLYAMHRAGGMVLEDAASVAATIAAPSSFSAGAFLSRCWDLVRNFVSEVGETDTAFMFKATVFTLGTASLIIRAISGKIERKLAFFPFWTFLVACSIIALNFFSDPASQMISGIFFHQEGRLAEALFFAQAIVFFEGIVVIYRTFTCLQLRVAVAAGSAALSMLFLGFLFRYHFDRIIEVRKHLLACFDFYHSPKKSETEQLASLIREVTEPHALLLYRPYLGDSLPARTEREGILVYGECSYRERPDETENCVNRRRYVDEIFERIRNSVAQGGEAEECKFLGKDFSRPVYAIFHGQEAKDMESRIDGWKCGKRRAVYRIPGFVVIKLERKPIIAS